MLKAEKLAEEYVNYNFPNADLGYCGNQSKQYKQAFLAGYEAGELEGLRIVNICGEWNNDVHTCEFIQRCMELNDELQKVRNLIPKWHDLREDPDDTPPKEKYSELSIPVISDKGVIVFYDEESDAWWDAMDDDAPELEVIKWCKIPKFEEE